MPPEFNQLTILLLMCHVSATANNNSARTTTTALDALFSPPTALQASSGQGGEFDNHSETEIALDNNKFGIYCYFGKLVINLKNQGVLACGVFVWRERFRLGWFLVQFGCPLL